MSSELIALLSQATPAPGGAQPAPGWFEMIGFLGPFVVLLLIFWFLVFGAKRKQERERKSMLESLKKGDRIRTIGGELGAVVDVRDSKVLVKVDESSNTKIWYVRDAIAGVEKEDK